MQPVRLPPGFMGSTPRPRPRRPLIPAAAVLRIQSVYPLASPWKLALRLVFVLRLDWLACQPPRQPTLWPGQAKAKEPLLPGWLQPCPMCAEDAAMR